MRLFRRRRRRAHVSRRPLAVTRLPPKGARSLSGSDRNGRGERGEARAVFASDALGARGGETPTRRPQPAGEGAPATFWCAAAGGRLPWSWRRAADDWHPVRRALPALRRREVRHPARLTPEPTRGRTSVARRSIAPWIPAAVAIAHLALERRV